VWMARQWTLGLVEVRDWNSEILARFRTRDGWSPTTSHVSLHQHLLLLSQQSIFHNHTICFHNRPKLASAVRDHGCIGQTSSCRSLPAYLGVCGVCWHRCFPSMSRCRCSFASLLISIRSSLVSISGRDWGAFIRSDFSTTRWCHSCDGVLLVLEA
jgi:hypothetical protein